MSEALTKEEFCERFAAHMLKKVGPKDASGGDVAAYAKETAPSYWEDQHQDGLSPEECAETDLSYWEPA
jgi:hypothetical protein